MDTLSSPAKNGKRYIIYALCDPRDQSTRYIGITSDPSERFRQHLACDGSNMEKDLWIKELKSDHMTPVMDTIEMINGRDNARDGEKYWIQYYLSLGALLLNKRSLKDRKRYYYVTIVLRKEHFATQNIIAEAERRNVSLGFLAREAVYRTYGGQRATPSFSTIQALAMGHRPPQDK